MESLPAPTGREFVLWRRLLLIVSLFSFWSLPTTAQLAIVSTSAAEGSDVLLRMRNKPPDITAFIWSKGEGANPTRYIVATVIEQGITIRGPEFSWRETIDKDGSLLIKNVTLKDAGHYTVVVLLRSGMKEIGFGRLLVYDPEIFVYLLASNSTVTENKDAVVLTCYTNAVSIQWLFNGLNLQLLERMKLSEDRRRLTIDPVNRDDAGVYQCEGSNSIRSIYSSSLVLHVKFD